MPLDSAIASGQQLRVYVFVAGNLLCHYFSLDDKTPILERGGRES